MQIRLREITALHRRIEQGQILNRINCGKFRLGRPYEYEEEVCFVVMYLRAGIPFV